MSMRRLSAGDAARPTWLLLLVGLSIFAFAIAARMLEQEDLPWHLAFGRQIIRERAIPTVDVFSFAAANIRYVSVVSDLILYGLFELGGPLALQLFGALLAVSVACILIGRSLEHGIAGIALAALGLFTIYPWFSVRPATMTFLFFASLLALIEVHRRNPTGRKGKRALVFALLLMPLWANSHGGAIIGVLALYLYAGHRTLATYLAARAPRLLPSSDGGALLLPWTMAVLASTLVLVNPAGVSYFTAVVQVSSYSHLISEWQSSSINYFVEQLPTAGAFFILCAGIFAFAREPDGSRVPPLYELVLTGAAFLMISKVRFIPIAVIILVPIVARRMGRFCRDTARVRLTLASTVAIAGISIVSVDRTAYGIGWEPSRFPEAAVSFVEKQDLHGRMWNFWPYGGYLIWRLYPRYQVSLDGRFGLVTYERDYVLRAAASDTDDDAFQQMVAEYDIEWAFCYARGDVFVGCKPVAKNPEWAMIYWDDLAAIYVKRSGRNRVLARQGYRVLRHLTSPEGLIDAVLRGVQRENISHDGALAWAQNPRSTRALFFGAVGALAMDDGPRFLEALQALGELAPYHPALPALLELVPRMRLAGQKQPP
jgi:hypothetical protein